MMGEEGEEEREMVVGSRDQIFKKKLLAVYHNAKLVSL